MPLDPSTEPLIDTSLSHYLEERALAIALVKAGSPAQHQRIERLRDSRRVLVEQRAAFAAEATAKRHARGEIYSKARVAAINSMGPTKTALDASAKHLYERQVDSIGVLQMHARVHFAHSLVSARLLLASTPPDIATVAAEMQRREEGFATEWIRAAGDADFAAEMRRLQREALCALRTASRPMHLATHPEARDLDDASAAALGKAWSKLDSLAQTAGVDPLSAFIALPDEPAAAGAPATQVLATTETLLAALTRPEQKLAGKRAVVAALTEVRAALTALPADGRAHFEIDV